MTKPQPYKSEAAAVKAAVELSDKDGQSIHVVVDGKKFYALTSEQWDRSAGYRLYEIKPEGII